MECISASLYVLFFKKNRFPVAEYLSRNGFYLPAGLAITPSQQKFVINKIKKVVSEQNQGKFL